MIQAQRDILGDNDRLNTTISLDGTGIVVLYV